MPELVTHDGVPDDEDVVARWDAVVAADPLGGFFHTAPYLRLWVRELGGRVVPRVHEVVEDGRTIGVVPVGLHREGAPDGPEEVVRFLGGEAVTDYVGPVAGPEHRAAVADAYVERLVEDSDWDEFVAAGLVVGSGWQEHWDGAAQRHGLRSLGTVEDDVCPRLDLGDGYESYLRTLSSKQRSEQKRKARKLHRDTGGYELVEVPPDQHDDALERFFAMNEQLVDDKGRFFAEDSMQEWFRALSAAFAPDGVLRVHELVAGGIPAASCVSIVHGGEWWLYNSAYDVDLSTLAPGMVIVGELVKVAAEEGCTAFDLLRGDEEYKYRFGPEERRLVVGVPSHVTVVPLAAGAVPQRVGMVSVHTSPLDQPGSGDGGGLNVYVLQTARRLAARGVEVDVFTRRADDGLAPTEVLGDGLRLHRIDAGPPGPMPKTDLASRLCAFVMGMERHPTAGSFDVLHAHYWLSGWVARRLRRSWEAPVVVTYHTLGALKNKTLAPGDTPEPALRLVAERRIAEDADRVAVLTCGEARIVHRTFGVSGMRIGVVPAGVDLEAFGPDGPVVGVPGAGPLLLFVGRLQPLKGPDVAVRTLAAVRETVPDARLAVLGGASGTGNGRSDPEQLRQLAATLDVADAVSFHPPVPQHELGAWYRAADVLLAPSRSETFGLVALEAQACGTPVVAADVPGLRATVRGGGLLVDGHDPADHAAAVVSVLTDERTAAELRTNGLLSAAATTWDGATDRLLRLYGEAMVAVSPLAAAG